MGRDRSKFATWESASNMHAADLCVSRVLSCTVPASLETRSETRGECRRGDSCLCYSLRHQLYPAVVEDQEDAKVSMRPSLTHDISNENASPLSRQNLLRRHRLSAIRHALFGEDSVRFAAMLGKCPHSLRQGNAYTERSSYGASQSLFLELASRRPHIISIHNMSQIHSRH